MKRTFLFPHRYKKVGWLLLLPAFIVGLVSLILEWEPTWLDMQVPSILVDELFGEEKWFASEKNNILNEICGVLVILGGLLVAFSKERLEDEYIGKIRLESLVWATYVNYGVLLLALLFVYGLTFWWVMIFNMFTLLIFFIIRFNWTIRKMKNTDCHEE